MRMIRVVFGLLLAWALLPLAAAPAPQGAELAERLREAAQRRERAWQDLALGNSQTLSPGVTTPELFTGALDGCPRSRCWRSARSGR